MGQKVFEHIMSMSHAARPCGQSSLASKVLIVFYRQKTHLPPWLSTLRKHHTEQVQPFVSTYRVTFLLNKIECADFTFHGSWEFAFFAHYILLYLKDLSHLDDRVAPVNTWYRLWRRRCLSNTLLRPTFRKCAGVCDSMLYLVLSLKKQTAHFCFLLSPSFHIPHTYINEFSYLTDCLWR